VAERIWLVSFSDFDLAYFEDAEGRVECAENPLRG